jgi:cell division protein FtsB
MDLLDITQVALVATVVLVFGRIGWSFARLIDRRASRQPALPDDAAERIRALEEEQLALRQEVAELQERQDFTERALLREQPPKRDLAAPERIATPQ